MVLSSALIGRHGVRAAGLADIRHSEARIERDVRRQKREGRRSLAACSEMSIT